MASNSTIATLSNGRSMPLLGLGTWKSGAGEVEAAVKVALKLGYRHVDCAAVYRNETEVGKGIRAACDEYNINREDVFVTSKLWSTKHHSEDVEPACRETLAKLGLDYLDLYLIHWPHAFKRGDELFPLNEDGTMQYDFDVHPTDTWLAMEKLVEKGLVRSIGVSNFNAAQIQDIISKGTIKPVTNQVESHPYFPQWKLKEFCAQHDIVLTAYSPLGSPDRPWATEGEPTLLDDPKIAEIAKRIGKSPAQVLLRWQVQRKVAVIPKSVTASRISENWNIWDFSLSDEDMNTLGAMGRADGRYVALKRDEKHPHFPFKAEF